MLSTLGLLLGGIGLFLLAVGMITDGLKLAAGNTLKDILGRYTSTPLRGVASGMLITGVVQSSSAVTVATIGFVNAGLLSLTQALGVVYGANIGTTVTGWLVAGLGFGLELELLALPLVGLGMLARLVGGTRWAGALGEAIAGFGLLFIGIDVLRDAFTEVAGRVDVAAFAPQGGAGLALYVVLGAVMTVLTQSSSAAIALTLTAASGGALSIAAAAAMVIGANVGTTSTAALAAVGATPNARRVAAAHVAFNGVTALVALMLLPGLLWLIGRSSAALGLDTAPAAMLALFHTLFNVLGVALMWPFTSALAGWLSHRFTSAEETLARPRFLDRNVLVAPALALEALKRELLHAAALARETVAAAVSAEQPTPPAVRARLQGLRGLLANLEAFVTSLEAGRLAPDLAGELPLVLRVSNYLEDVVALVADLDAHRLDLDAVNRPPAQAAIAAFQAAVAAQVGRCDAARPDFDGIALDDGFDDLKRRWHDLKSVLLEGAARRALPVAAVNGALEGLRSTLRMAEQLSKAARRLHELPPSHRAVLDTAVAEGGGATAVPDGRPADGDPPADGDDVTATAPATPH